MSITAKTLSCEERAVRTPDGPRDSPSPMKTRLRPSSRRHAGAQTPFAGAEVRDQLSPACAAFKVRGSTTSSAGPTSLPCKSAIMSASPAVSVILAVIHGAPHLTEAIGNLRAQSAQEWELIRVDDGSTEESRDVLEELARGDSRVRMVSRMNTGPAGAPNEALALAHAPLVAMIDADDISLPVRLATQAAFLCPRLEGVCEPAPRFGIRCTLPQTRPNRSTRSRLSPATNPGRPTSLQSPPPRRAAR
jgi:hypothetical protein